MKKLLFLLAFIILFPVKTVLANFSDRDTVLGNQASTGWWVKPAVSITSPNGGEKIKPGEIYSLTWSAASTDPSSPITVDLYYSLDDGVTYTSITTGEVNDSLYLWTVPTVNSFFAKIKIIATDSHGLTNSDESDAVFTIANAPVTTLKVNNKSVAEIATLGPGVTQVGSSDPVNPGNTFDQNVLSQTISNTVKNVFFSYNFSSYDFPPYDAPGFRFSVNDQPLLELHAKDVNPDSQAGVHSTGWQNFSFDPSIFSTPSLDLLFMAGNSSNALDLNSWVDIKNLTTTKVFSNPSTLYTATTTSGTPSITVTPTTVTYYSVDPLLPAETSKTQDVTLKSSLLLAIADLDFVATTSSSLTLRWTSNGGVAYDLSFGSTRVTPWPTPRPSGQEMETTVTGLTASTNYCFTVKSVDDTPQWSLSSPSVCAKTLATPPVANPGDVIINEIMWMGDEWIELKNTTANAIDLTGWTIGGVTLSGSIAANSYYLLGNNPSADQVATLGLNDSGQQLILKASDEMVIDQTPSSWPVGTISLITQTTERNDDPGSGWHLCDDSNCNSVSYWNVSGSNYGTPRFANLSAKDKSSQEYRQAIVKQVATQSATLSLSFADHKISLGAINLSNYKKLSYELIYDTDTVSQGVTGTVDLSDGQTEFSKEILTGTCSTGGTCVYHLGVKNIKLIMTLINKNDAELILDKSL